MSALDPRIAHLEAECAQLLAERDAQRQALVRLRSAVARRQAAARAYVEHLARKASWCPYCGRQWGEAHARFCLVGALLYPPGATREDGGAP